VEGLHGGHDADEGGVTADELVHPLWRHLVLELRQEDVLHHASASRSCRLRRHSSRLLLCLVVVGRWQEQDIVVADLRETPPIIAKSWWSQSTAYRATTA
jgi:hypothetical protein